MADIWTVFFTIGGEPTQADFEFEGNAKALAEILEEAGVDYEVEQTF